MDPDATLEEIRGLVAESNRSGQLPSEEETERLVVLIDALDNWIVQGGFLPRAWKGG